MRRMFYAVFPAVLALLTVAVLGATVSYASTGTVNTANVGAHVNHQTPVPQPEPLAVDCSKSLLPPHTGFQIAPACVNTSFGELNTQPLNPSLLIVDSPRRVKVGEPIVLKVSTRNLVRDRFLGAAAGGYYLESSTLDAAGLQRGHFHTACRLILDDQNAPVAERNAAFIATEDGGGGADPDTVTVTLAAGLPERGEAQCAVWAGDGSHRTPMMQFANQIPAFDTVRFKVRGKVDQPNTERNDAKYDDD